MMEYRVGIDASVSSTGVAIQHAVCGSEILIGWTHGKRLASSRKQSRANAKTCLCGRLKMISQTLLLFQLPIDIVKMIVWPYARGDWLLTRILPYPVLGQDISYEGRLDTLTEMVLRNISLFVPEDTKSCSFTLEAVPLHMEHSSSVSILRDFSAVLRNKIFNVYNGPLIMELSPSTIKKKWTGKGNCKKPDMYRCFREYYETHGFPVAHEADMKFYGFDVPLQEVKAEHKPLQDMVDARAILPIVHASSSKTRKRKAVMMMTFEN